MHGWQHAEEESDHHEEPAGEGEHTPVHLDGPGCESSEVLRRDAHQRLDTQESEQYRGPPGKRGQDETLHEELARDPRLASSQR